MEYFKNPVTLKNNIKWISNQVTAKLERILKKKGIFQNPKIKQIHADKDYAIIARGEDKYNHFMKYEPPTSLFSKKDLDFHLHLRKVQAKALTKGSRKGINLYQGNREIA